jgi:GDP-mannose 6-dehydrogenase
MRVSIFGIGYVGAVTAACLAEAGHTVIAVDIDPRKASLINGGKAPIVEKGLDSLIERNVREGRLSATTDGADAVARTDISLLCVGTPSLADGTLDLSYVITTCETVASALKSKKTFHTVVLRSTMLPGSALERCLPTLERLSGKKAGVDFGFGNNPEFLREGSAIADYYNPPKIVVGAQDEKSAALIMQLYQGIDATRVITDMTIAEGVKYADNAWHAFKVGFANEIGNVMKECGVDSHKVMDIFCMDKKLNISPAYLKPGFAFGGSCLPKDVNALRGLARAKGVGTPLFDALMDSNKQQVERAFHMIKATGRRKISILGLSFKAGTDDLRESPMVALSKRLLKEGYEIKIYDTNVSAATPCTPATQNILKNLVTDKKGVIDGTELYVIGNKGEDFAAIINESANDDIPVIDLVRLNETIETRSGYHGICW